MPLPCSTKRTKTEIEKGIQKKPKSYILLNFLKYLVAEGRLELPTFGL